MSLNSINASITTNQTSSFSLSNSSSSVDRSLNSVNASITTNQTSSLSLSNSSSSVDRSLNSVNASISTNQASSLSLSKSSSSMDFELDDATQKISSASNRVSSLSSQSSKGDLDVSSGSTIPRIDESLADPFKTIQEFVSALDIDYTSYKGESVIEKGQGEEATLDDQERAGKLARRLGLSESDRDIDSIRADILAQIAQRFGPFDPNAAFPLADFIDANASLTPPSSSSSSQSGTPQGGSTIVQNSSQRTLLTPPASTGPPGGSGDSEK